MLKSEKTVLIVVDVQGKLAQLMTGRQALFELLETAQGAPFKKILKIVKSPAARMPFSRDILYFNFTRRRHDFRHRRIQTAATDFKQ